MVLGVGVKVTDVLLIISRDQLEDMKEPLRVPSLNFRFPFIPYFFFNILPLKTRRMHGQEIQSRFLKSSLASQNYSYIVFVPLLAPFMFRVSHYFVIL